MEVTGGSLSYTATIDYSQLEAAVKNIESRLSSIESVANTTGEALDKMGGGLEKVLAAIGGFAAVKQFTSQMFNVRKSFQDTQSVMEVFLGSAESAEAHMKELQKYAWYNMFDFETLTKASAQLQAFGTDVGDVIPLIDRLSNIAAGTKTDLMELVATFNRAKSVGTADSHMLRSFATKGLDVVNTLRDMGVAVSDTSVTFEQLMVAVNAATDEGGRFYNLMDSQFENLSSLAGAVEDDISIMFNDIGEKLQPAMENVLKFTHKLIDNYENIGRVLVAMLATYGAYRTALVTTTILQNLQAAGVARLTALERIHYTWLVLQEKAQSLLNKTVLKNPYVLLATVLFGIISSLIAYTKATKDSRTEEEKLNDRLEERLKNHKELIETADGYIDTIVNETENVKKLNEAYENLSKLEPFKNMSIEELMGKDTEELTKMIKDFDNEVQQKTLEDFIKNNVSKYKSAWGQISIVGTNNSGQSRITASTNADYMTDASTEALAENSKYIDFVIMGLQKLDSEQKKLKYAEMIDSLEKQNEKLKENNEIVTRNGVSYESNALEIELNNQAIERYTQNLNDLNNVQEANTLPIFDENDERSVISQIKIAEEELSNLRKQMVETGMYTPEMITKINAAEKNLQSSKSLYKTLTGKEYGKTDKSNLQQKRAAQDAELALIQDSYTKERKAAQIDAERKIEDLKTTLKEEEKLTDDGKKSINRQITAIRKKLLKNLEDIDNAHITQVIKTKKQLQELDESLIQQETNWANEKEEAKIALMTNGFNKEIAELQLEHTKRLQEIENEKKEEEDLYEENAKNRYLLENKDKTENDFYAQWTGIPKEEQDKIDKKMQERLDAQNKLYAKKQQQTYDDLLSQYADYEGRRKQIEDKYDSDIETMTRMADTLPKGSEERIAIEKAISQAYENEAAELKNLEVENSKLIKLEAERSQLETDIQLAISNGSYKDASGNYTDEYEKLKKKLQDVLKEIQNIDDEFSNATTPKKGLGDYFKDFKTEDWLNAATQVTGVFSQIGEAAGLDGLRDVGDALTSIGNVGAKIASGDYLGAALQVLTDIGTAIANDIAKTKQLEQAMAQSAETAKQWNIQDMLEGNNTIFGDNLIESIKQYTDALQMARQAQRDLVGDALTEMKTVDYSWIGNIFGKSDEKNSIADFAHEMGLELYDEYGNLNADTLQLFLDTYEDIDDANRQWINNAIEYSNEYKEAMDNIASYLSDLFGGVAESIADQMVESFIATGDAAVDLGSLVADVGKQMAKDLVKSLIIKTYFDGMEEDFKNQIAKNGMNADTAGYIIGKMNEAMTALGNDTEYWNNVIANLSGLWEGAESASASAGTALASASQESIDLMNGQINAMRNVQLRIDGKIDNILTELRNFHTDTNGRLDNGNNKLDKIIENTSENGSIVRGIGIYF